MSQGVQICLQKKLCPVFKGFCRPNRAWQNPFCHFRVLPTGSGVLPRTLEGIRPIREASIITCS